MNNNIELIDKDIIFKIDKIFFNLKNKKFDRLRLFNKQKIVLIKYYLFNFFNIFNLIFFLRKVNYNYFGF